MKPFTAFLAFPGDTWSLVADAPGYGKPLYLSGALPEGHNRVHALTLALTALQERLNRPMPRLTVFTPDRALVRANLPDLPLRVHVEFIAPGAASWRRAVIAAQPSAMLTSTLSLLHRQQTPSGALLYLWNGERYACPTTLTDQEEFLRALLHRTDVRDWPASAQRQLRREARVLLGFSFCRAPLSTWWPEHALPSTLTLAGQTYRVEVRTVGTQQEQRTYAVAATGKRTPFVPSPEGYAALEARLLEKPARRSPPQPHPNTLGAVARALTAAPQSFRELRRRTGLSDGLVRAAVSHLVSSGDAVITQGAAGVQCVSLPVQAAVEPPQAYTGVSVCPVEHAAAWALVLHLPGRTHPIFLGGALPNASLHESAALAQAANTLRKMGLQHATLHAPHPFKLPRGKCAQHGYPTREALDGPAAQQARDFADQIRRALPPVSLSPVQVPSIMLPTPYVTPDAVLLGGHRLPITRRVGQGQSARLLVQLPHGQVACLRQTTQGEATFVRRALPLLYPEFLPIRIRPHEVIAGPLRLPLDVRHTRHRVQLPNGRWIAFSTAPDGIAALQRRLLDDGWIRAIRAPSRAAALQAALGPVPQSIRELSQQAGCTESYARQVVGRLADEGKAVIREIGGVPHVLLA